ncbi:DUF2917 domain-containing protein [Pyxidicoccus trucidator]|uniref:DUF2917 domain-containing protein n=1 Tax=Pyxidicoccus trucidator TaxID=2709662 RepID=UPI0013DD3E30|nr:DUF2917 domain-containing protein [Pyxidicoccus trucidator]
MAATLTFTFHDWLRALAEWLRPGAHRNGSEERVLLERGATWGMHTHGGEHLALTCDDGQLWLTCEGDSRDYVLGPGHTVRLKAPGHVVVQALRLTRFNLVRWPSSLARAMEPREPEAHAP